MSLGVLQPTERRFESAPGRADEKSCWNSSQLCTRFAASLRIVGRNCSKKLFPSSGCELLVAGIHSRAVCSKSLELQREGYPSALLLLLLLLCVLFCIFDLKDQQLNDLHSRTASEWFQSLLCKYQPDAVFILALHREFSTRFLCVLLSSWLLICDVLFLVEEIAVLLFLESEKIAYKALLSKVH
jgi:hypothetical protein